MYKTAFPSAAQLRAAKQSAARDATSTLRKSKVEALRKSKRGVGALPSMPCGVKPTCATAAATRPAAPPHPISTPSVDVVGPAVELLMSSKTPDAALAALYDIKTMSNDDSLVEDLIQHPSTVTVLAGSLLKPLPPSFETMMMTSQCLDCLCNLSMRSSGCLKIVAVPGFMDALVTRHLTSPSPAVTDSGLALIANLSADSAELRGAILQIGALPAALRHISTLIASQECPKERYVDTFVWCLTNLLQCQSTTFDAVAWRRLFDLAMPPLTHLIDRVPWRAMDPDIAAMMLDVVHKLLENLNYTHHPFLRDVGCHDAVGALFRFWADHQALYTDARLFRTALYRLLQCCKLLSAGPETVVSCMNAAVWPVIRAMVMAPPPTRSYLRDFATSTLRGYAFHVTFAQQIYKDEELLRKLTRLLASGETPPAVRADVAQLFHLLMWRLRYVTGSGAGVPSSSLLDTLITLNFPAALVRNLKLHVDVDLTAGVLSCIEISIDLRRTLMLEMFEELRLPSAIDALMEDEAVKASSSLYTRLSELSTRYFGDDSELDEDDLPLADVSDNNPFAHFV